MSTARPDEVELDQAVPIFRYGDKHSIHSPGISDSFCFPDPETTAELLSVYFDFAMPTYRFLNQPTVSAWLAEYHAVVVEQSPGQPLLPARQALVLMVLATAVFLQADDKTEASEPYFQMAETQLARESGKVRIESAQARLAMCLYLLHTSRPNQAWYVFGVTVQLIRALGMHRARPSTSELDAITAECRKRTFWAAFSLDTYLSCILGRPALIHVDDVDQQFPAVVDDDEITGTGIVSNGMHRDPVIQGSIYHSKITGMARKALREQYSVHNRSDAHKLEVATRLNSELADWKSSLPVILSGAVHPSSLVQIFQRQIVVLQMAHSLALILVNRPLLLVDRSIDNKANAHACLSAARCILDTVAGFVANRKTFPAFWFTVCSSKYAPHDSRSFDTTCI